MKYHGFELTDAEFLDLFLKFSAHQLYSKKIYHDYLAEEYEDGKDDTGISNGYKFNSFHDEDQRADRDDLYCEIQCEEFKTFLSRAKFIKENIDKDDY